MQVEEKELYKVRNAYLESNNRLLAKQLEDKKKEVRELQKQVKELKAKLETQGIQESLFKEIS